MEEGPSLGRGEDGWCGVGVGGRDCHDGRMQMRWGAGLGREGEKREGVGAVVRRGLQYGAMASNTDWR